MTAMQYAVLAYTVGLGLLWFYAARLALSYRAASRRARREGGKA
jgi:hypothetical protein